MITDFYKVVEDYAKARYGKNNILKLQKYPELGMLGGTRITLKNGEGYTLYFHYQIEKVCVLGESYY